MSFPTAFGRRMPPWWPRMNGKDTDLLRVADLELVLAKLPVGDGPLVIEKIIAKEPVGRLVLTEHGFVGERGW